MKRSNNILGGIVVLAVLVMVLVWVGAPGLRPADPHDADSVAALPYTLVGENELWRAEYRLGPADEEVKTLVDAELELAYQAVFTLTYLGDSEDLNAAVGYTVTFGKNTDYKAGGKGSRSEPGGLTAELTGKTPIWTLYYPEDTSVAGAIPPLDGTYSVQIELKGLKTANATLTMTKEAVS